MDFPIQLKNILLKRVCFLIDGKVFLDCTVSLCDWNVISFNKMNKVIYFQENSLNLPPQF